MMKSCLKPQRSFLAGPSICRDGLFFGQKKRNPAHAVVGVAGENEICFHRMWCRIGAACSQLLEILEMLTLEGPK
jgi:hypothetical protein